ncbi:MAG: AAA family ATPase [Bacteroidales bacterium]
MEIVGRQLEQKALRQYATTHKPEFVAVYGRRRVGKTFLIKETFKNDFTFYVAAIANSNLDEQLHNFNVALNQYGNVLYPKATTWFAAFKQLINLLENTKKKGKKVIFIDEMPWMDTHKSRFISALEYFWNSWADTRTDVLLIVCGSATSWIINKLINSRGGLHNRVTRRMHIEPFTLKECEDYFRSNKIALSRYQITENYMIMGGIPYYLSLVEKGKSIAQNIDALFFSKSGALRNEFQNLYVSLFSKHDNHIKVVEALAKKKKGLTRKEIAESTNLLTGGTLTKTLEELEQCNFIDTYIDYDAKSKYQLHQLTDPYTLFYMNYIKAHRNTDENYWSKMIDNAKHRAWSGYAFEQVCLAHKKQIKEKLGISGIISNISSWISKKPANKDSKGAQIDLLIDRNDNLINLCEIKYSKTEFSIDKKYEQALQNKVEIFRQETKTKKAIHITMITTFGLKRTPYFDSIQSEITMDDLFR